MKRIAFIDYGFTGSLLPLISRLTEAGHKVDLYEMASLGVVPKLEACTFEEVPCCMGVHDVPVSYYSHLSSYLTFGRFRLRYISAVRPMASIPVVRCVMAWVRRFQLRRAAGNINHLAYDVVNLVGNYWNEDYVPLLEHLRGARLLSLHEVCDHRSPDFSRQPSLIRAALSHSVPMVVFSETSRQDVLHYPGIKSSCVHALRFGLFESYRCMLRPSHLTVGRDYFLFVGYLLPYKGVDLFAQAISMIASRRQDIRFVIAGRGYDTSLDAIKDLPQVTILNQYIENDDFAYLLDNCYAVVCPYRSASQSGVPQSAFVFGRSVIASALPGFRRLLGEERYGLLADPGSVMSLANVIERLWDDRELHDSLEANVLHFQDEQPKYNWDQITQEYLKLIDTAL